jgi:cytochrome c-type biogenesis protein CcmH
VREGRTHTIIRFFNWALVIVVLLVLFLGLFGVSTVLAQQPTPPTDNDVNAVAHELYCPVCENISLDVCDTTACAQWRELIRQKLAQGWSKQQIEDYFAQQYGDRVLAEPPRRGLNWLVYLIPPLAFLGGVWLVYRVLSNMRRPPAPATPSGPAETQADPYTQQVEEELKKRE